MAVVGVEDRAFVPWLVVAPTEAELLRARHITPAQINRLEEAWKGNPKATVDDIDKPGEDDEPAHVALKWVLHLEPHTFLLFLSYCLRICPCSRHKLAYCIDETSHLSVVNMPFCLASSAEFANGDLHVSG